jgi:N-acetylneuraminic acid mutarotase
MHIRLLAPCILLLTGWSCATVAPEAVDMPVHAPSAIGGLTYPHCFETEGQFHILGGFRASEDLSPLNSLGASYDWQTKAWATWPSENGPPPKSNFASTTLGKDVYVFAGTETKKPFSRDSYVYHTDRKFWEKIATTDRIKERVNPTLTVLGEYIVAFGGKTSDHVSNWATYNTLTKQWKVYGDYAAERSSHVALTFGNKIFIWGGFVDGKRVKDGFVIDPERGELKPLLTGMTYLEERANAKAVTDGTTIFIIGGTNDMESRTDGAFYDNSNGSWGYIPSLPDRDRKDFEITLIPNEGILLFGGRNASGAIVESSYLLNFSSMKWVEVKFNISPSPTGRMAHCQRLAADKKSLHIFGGLTHQSGEGMKSSDELWSIPLERIEAK